MSYIINIYEWNCSKSRHAKQSQPCFTEEFVYFSLFSVTWPSNSYSDDSIASCGMASILLLSKSSSNGGLWNLYPCAVEVVVDVTDYFGNFFSQLSQCLCHQLLVFPLSIYSMSVAQKTISLFLFQDIPNFCVGDTYVCPLALNDFPSFLSFKLACFTTIVSSVVFMLVFRFLKKRSFYKWNPMLNPRIGIQLYLMFK